MEATAIAVPVRVDFSPNDRKNDLTIFIRDGENNNSLPILFFKKSRSILVPCCFFFSPITTKLSLIQIFII